MKRSGGDAEREEGGGKGREAEGGGGRGRATEEETCGMARHRRNRIYKQYKIY